MYNNDLKSNATFGIPKISVIVCTHNRENVILGCCESLEKQTIPGSLFEVIIVNNRSTDSTSSILSEFTTHSKQNNFVIKFEEKIGLSHARNLGVECARAEYVAFIDDDARAPNDWLSRALAIIHEVDPDIFGGPAFPLFDNGKPDWYKEEYAIRGDMGETGFLRDGDFLIGTNIFFRKTLILEYGGFDPTLGMSGNTIGYHEETSLLRRGFSEKKRIYYDKDLAVLDIIPEYKKSLLFFLFSRFKAGVDRVNMENQTFKELNSTDILELVVDIFNDFNFALLSRDAINYPYPENYVIEVSRPKLVLLGKWIGYFLKNTKKL